MGLKDELRVGTWSSSQDASVLYHSNQVTCPVSAPDCTFPVQTLGAAVTAQVIQFLTLTWETCCRHLGNEWMGAFSLRKQKTMSLFWGKNFEIYAYVGSPKGSWIMHTMKNLGMDFNYAYAVFPISFCSQINLPTNYIIPNFLNIQKLKIILKFFQPSPVRNTFHPPQSPLLKTREHQRQFHLEHTLGEH